MRFGDLFVISLSPELFFRRDHDQITMQPMKGTMARGHTLDEDARNEKQLAHDDKNRSENLMIVDLLRNDLGRICRIGSVRPTRMFEVEKYDTLFQMTSTIAGQLKPEIAYWEIFRSLYPCGSITGAPKIRTMQIIRELEDTARGIYTGALGFISPDQSAVFNVPIRTITIRDGLGEMGVGSGVVYDSRAELEFEECKLKAHFLVENFEDFALIETMLWQDGLRRLPLHLKRLSNSASYFGFICDLSQIRRRLDRCANQLSPGKSYKVRLLLHRDGDLDVTSTKLPRIKKRKCLVRISAARTFSGDRFLYHKSTRRALYDREFAEATKDGFADVLFMNEKDEVTEGAISNIFVLSAGVYYTPPVSSGVLPGTFREAFLARHPQARERILTLADLKQAEGVYLTNAVRGMVPVDSIES
jgi:para-aminobenzoate synthetase/4-amino-4-deoxychorismate lyase